MSVDESNALRDPVSARARFFDWRTRRLLARVQKDHGDGEAVAALAADYEKHADHASLADLMEAYAKTLNTAAAAAEAYVRAADAALLNADRKRAQALYEHALLRDPSHNGALDRALRVAESVNDVEAMRRILTAVLSAANARPAEPKLLASLHFRLGEVYELHLRDAEQAAQLYRAASALHPQFVKASAAARRLYERAGDHAAVSALYELDIEAAKVGADKHRLLLALAEHEQRHGRDLDAAVEALRRACDLEPSDASSLRKLADGLIARSAGTRGAARQRDREQAADALYQWAQSAPRVEAANALTEALALAPGHARATALLHELRGATGAQPASAASSPSPRAPAAQQVVDHRSTLKIFVAVDTQSRGAAQALSTADSMPARGEAPQQAPAAERSSVLSTSELMPLPAEPAQPPPTPLLARRVPADRTSALTTSELLPLTLPPPVPQQSGRARIVEQLEHDAARPTLELQLGVASESNLYVNMDNRLVDGGVFVASYREFAAGTALTLHIVLPGGLHGWAHARAGLRRDSLDPLADDATSGFYAAFEALTQPTLALLGRFAAKRTPLLVDDD